MKIENTWDLLLNKEEVLLLYTLLKSIEQQLDIHFMTLLNKFEKIVYEKLTIQEIENLKEFRFDTE